MRLVYLDESGTGAKQNEPHIVYAGIIVNADQDWTRVATELHALGQKYANRPNAFFHATDIYHGSGEWPREKYDRGHRLALLRELCKIPAKFGLHVVTAYIDKVDITKALDDDSPDEQTLWGLVATSVRCTIGVERFMRTVAGSGEVAVLVFENHDRAKKVIRETHNSLKQSTALNLTLGQANWKLSKFLPLERIVDTAHFADKADTPLLQVADACAFAVRRSLAGKDHGEELCQLFNKQLTTSLLDAGAAWFGD